jgi:hypothetical protein
MTAKDNRPIVVGGCYRSGTSLVRRLLDSHSRIHCGPEVKFFRDFYANYIDVEDPIAHLRFLTTAGSLLPERERLEVLGGAFVELHERAARRAGKPRWADKVPENMVFLGQWERLLGENWVLLHVVRNPLDTLASIKEVGFPRSVPRGLEERIYMYLRYAQAGLDFAERHPDRYVRLVYDDLVDRPEATLRTAVAALGEEFEPDQLRFNSEPRRPGLEDPRVSSTEAIHAESAGRWKEVLNGAEAEQIVEATSEIWLRLTGGARSMSK